MNPTFKDELSKLFLHGDVAGAYARLQATPDKPVWADKLQAQLRRRFFCQRPTLRWRTRDPWVRAVLSTYAAYFTQVLARRIPQQPANEALRSSLLRLLPEADTARTLAEAEQVLQQAFERRGLHFLGGVTSPYYGPYIWNRTEAQEYAVALPDNRVETLRVYFLHDFLLQSWLNYGSCGVFGTAGWAKPDGLYCVYRLYRTIIDQPAFRVSFLKHEAQHHADLRDYVSLPAAVLEYRAKAVELIYRRDSRLLRKFLAQAGPERDVPHAFASYCLLRDLKRESPGEDDAICAGILPGWLQQAALDCYRRSNRALRAALETVCADDAAKRTALTDSAAWNRLTETTRTAWEDEWLTAAAATLIAT